MSATSSTALAALQPRRPRDTLGRPLRDLRISVTDRCNFRCPYCMPRERYHEHYRFLKSAERLDFGEIVRLTRLFVARGMGNPGEVLGGIAAAQHAGLAPLKINAVVQRGVNDHTVIALLEHFRGTG